MVRKKRVFERRFSKRCIEYWLHYGYTEEEGKQEISKIQSRGRNFYKSEEDYQKRLEKLRAGKQTPEYRNKISKKQKELNTLSYWVNKFGEEEGNARYKARINQRKENSKFLIQSDPIKRRERSCRCIEHWIKKGFSEGEAKAQVSRVQTRSLDFFTGKYGKEKGIEIWKKKKEDWFESFCKNDLTSINEKRKLNAHIGIYSKKTIIDIPNLYFYILLVKDLDGTIFLKYGLTKQDNIRKRWSLKYGYKLLIFSYMPSIVALNIEEKMKKTFPQYKPEIFKTMEATIYSEIVLLEMYNIIYSENNNERSHTSSTNI